MKKIAVLSLGAVLLLSSCGTYTGTGAYVGGSFGSIIGSAIGGISGGPRGSDIGTLIGMAGGAAVGAAIGSAADQARQEEISGYHQRQVERNRRERQQTYDNGYGNGNDGEDAYYDPQGGGDDRIDFKAGNGSDYGLNSTVEHNPGRTAERDGLSISNVRFIDGTGNDQAISAGEICKLSFDVRNNSSQPIYNVQPSVVETTGNRHIIISQGVSIERIAPGRGIRYTAMIKADSRLRNGNVNFRAAARNGATQQTVSVDDIVIETKN